jgi:hypothetical protein
MTHGTFQSDQQLVIRRSFTRAAYCDPALPDDLLETLWQRPEILVETGERLRWKVRRTVLVEWASRKYVLKHYVEQSRRHSLARLIQPCRARITWSFTRRLADAGIATPRPVACIENRWGKLRRDSFLMYPYVEGATLRTYFDNQAKQSPSTYGGLWQQLDVLWQQLTRMRVSLADMNPGNFIVCPAGQLWLIDLDKGRFHRVAYVGARYQQRRWKRLLQRAAECERQAAR